VSSSQLPAPAPLPHTAPLLPSAALFEFRTRAVSGAGAGAWSAASRPMATLLATPPACCGGITYVSDMIPQAPVLTIGTSKSDRISSSSVYISSSSISSGGGSGSGRYSSGNALVSLTVQWGAVKGVVQTYEVQLRSQWDNAWSSVHRAVRYDDASDASDASDSSHKNAVLNSSPASARASVFVHTVTGLTPNAQYIARVRAVNNAGAGLWSPVSMRSHTTVQPRQQLNHKAQRAGGGAKSMGRVKAKTKVKLSEKKKKEVRGGVLPGGGF